MSEPPLDPLSIWEGKQNPKMTDYDVAAKLGWNQSTIWRAKRTGRFHSVDLMDQIEGLTGIAPNQWRNHRKAMEAYKTKKARKTKRKTKESC